MSVYVLITYAHMITSKEVDFFCKYSLAIAEQGHVRYTSNLIGYQSSLDT